MAALTYTKKTPKNFGGEYQPYRIFGPGRFTELGKGCAQVHEAKSLIEDAAKALEISAPSETGMFCVIRRSTGKMVASIGLENFPMAVAA